MASKKLLCSIIIGIIFFTAPANAQNLQEFKAAIVNKTPAELKNKFSHFTAVRLESAKLTQFVKGKASASFHLNLTPALGFDIELEPSNIVSQHYALKIQTTQGIQTLASKPDFLYKGKVKGSGNGEEVRLAIKEGFIYGCIQNDGKEYFIEPLNRFTVSGGKDEYIIYEAKDVIQSQSFACGFKDNENIIAKESEALKTLDEQSPQSNICKKVKFISVADYSIYQKFGSDVYAVETALLANLNLAEGAFTTLNLGPDGSTDVGEDKLQFEMQELVVSVCKECGVFSNTESAADLATEMYNYHLKFYPDQGNSILQLWTNGSLFDLEGGPIGGAAINTVDCTRPARQILRYLFDDAAFLRMLVAHETGHSLGCRHDDDVKPDVKGFIMYSRSSPQSTRLSTLADFGGGSYSSQKRIHDFIKIINCVSDCVNTSCEGATDIAITYYNTPDSISLKWNGTGDFIVRYKVFDSANYNINDLQEISGNTITLRNLKPCTIYEAELQKKCSNTEYGPVSTIILNTSSLVISGQPVNSFGDQYDLEIDIACKNCSSNEYTVKVDNKPYAVSNNSELKKIGIKNLFADGARHRIDVSKDSGSVACTSTAFYTAPYYRSNSINILGTDFNDCGMPMGWKDSLLAKSIVSAPTALWFIAEKNRFSLATPRGNFDSTCLISFNTYHSFGPRYSGAVSLTSPSVDLTKYKDLKLHFDYNFYSYRSSSSADYPSILIEVYNGSEWTTVFKRESVTAPPNTLIPRVNIWDSLPTRVFIDLDKYKNKDFKIRIIADDGSFASNESGYIFAAFDNIRVDGYLENSQDSTSNIIFYPNPAKDELFIKFTEVPIGDINYTLTDLYGRIIRKEKLNNYRIDLKGFSAGMYFIKVYLNEKLLKTVKIIHQP